MNVLIILFSCLLLQFQENHRIEIFIFEEKCIPIDALESSRSFNLTWYDYAREYKPQGVPLLTAHDILRFDIDNFKFELSDNGAKIMSDLTVPGKGIPVQLVIDGEVVYGAWIWNMLSSRSCDGVMFEMLGGDTHALHVRSFSQQSKGLRIPKMMK